MANIQNLRANVNPQKSYMWEVNVRGLPGGVIEDMDMYAKNVSIPQTAVEQIIINHKGSRTHHAGRDASAHTVTITFWDDEKLTIYKFFNDWLNLMHDQDTGAGIARDQYAADLVIKLKDSTDTVTTGKITMTKAFPIDLGEVPLSYDGSEPVEITVTMSFDGKYVE